MLGRYAADRTITTKNANIRLVHEKVVLLYGHFSHTFRADNKGECNCNQTTVMTKVRCNFTDDRDAIEGLSSAEILTILIECFRS